VYLICADYHMPFRERKIWVPEARYYQALSGTRLPSQAPQAIDAGDIGSNAYPLEPYHAFRAA
jgi:hypothetical protein